MGYGNHHGIKIFSGNNKKKIEEDVNKWLLEVYDGINEVESIHTSESMVELDKPIIIEEKPKKGPKPKKIAKKKQLSFLWNMTMIIHYTYDGELEDDVAPDVDENDFVIDPDKEEPEAEQA